MVPLSIGTDTGGSIRGPANFCGIVGLKQTYGRVSRHGVTTLAWSLDHAGPMTRTVADAAADAAGHRRRRPARSVDARADPVPDYTRAADRRYAVACASACRRVTSPTTRAPEDRPPRTAPRSPRLKDLGATLVDVDVPHAPVCDGRPAGWWRWPKRPQFHEKRLRDTPRAVRPGRPRAARRGALLPATDYIKAQRVRTLLMAEMAAVFTARAMSWPCRRDRPAAAARAAGAGRHRREAGQSKAERVSAAATPFSAI